MFADDAFSGKSTSTLFQNMVLRSDSRYATLQLPENREGECSWMAEVLRLCWTQRS